MGPLVKTADEYKKLKPPPPASSATNLKVNKRTGNLDEAIIQQRNRIYEKEFEQNKNFYDGMQVTLKDLSEKHIEKRRLYDEAFSSCGIQPADFEPNRLLWYKKSRVLKELFPNRCQYLLNGVNNDKYVNRLIQDLTKRLHEEFDMPLTDTLRNLFQNGLMQFLEKNMWDEAIEKESEIFWRS